MHEHAYIFALFYLLLHLDVFFFHILGAHELLRMTESFGRGTYFSRNCYCTHPKDKNCIKRTKELRDYDIQNAQAMIKERQEKLALKGKISLSEGIPTYRGVKEACIFDELRYFEPTTGFPPCVLHDFFECVVKVDIPLLLNLLKDQIDLSSINEQFKKITKHPNESIASYRHKEKSIEGSGMMVRYFLKYLVVVVLPFIEDGHESKPHEMIVLLNQMSLVLLAHRITPKMVIFYEYLCEEYLSIREKLLPSAPFTPKYHEVFFNYAEKMLEFGPLGKVDTRPGEHNHKFSKNTIKHTQNFINTPKSLSEVRAVYESSIFEKLEREPVFEMLKSEKLTSLEADNLQKHLNKSNISLNSKDFFSTEKLKFKGSNYDKTKLLITKDIKNRNYEGIIIDKIIFSSSHDVKNLYFFGERVICHYSVSFSILIVKFVEKKDFKLINYQDLYDYFPLNIQQNFNLLSKNERIVALRHAFLNF